jgi:hypothetical protein
MPCFRQEKRKKESGSGNDPKDRKDEDESVVKNLERSHGCAFGEDLFR